MNGMPLLLAANRKLLVNSPLDSSNALSLSTIEFESKLYRLRFVNDL